MVKNGLLSLLSAFLLTSSMLFPVPSLAEERTSRPSTVMVVDIHADWCSGCDHIAPTLSQLRKEYAGKAIFVTFDVTSQQTTKKAVKDAKRIGLFQWFDAHKNHTALVGIFKNGTERNLLINNANIRVYRQTISDLIEDK